MQFLGSIEAKIDAKTRVFVPAAFRKILQSAGQDVLILRKDVFQDCLVLYPQQVWENELTLLRSRLNRWDKSQQAVFRQFVVDAERIEIDSSGRILIPKRYCQLAGIISDVIFLGVDNTIEIWTRDSLDKSLMPIEDFSTQIQSLMSNNTKEL